MPEDSHWDFRGGKEVDWEKRGGGMKNFVRCVKKGGIREKIRVFCCRSLRGSVDWNQLRSLPGILRSMSLPTRERGLKSVSAVSDNDVVVSLPTRERGLKYRKNLSFLRWQRRSLRGSVDWNSFYYTPPLNLPRVAPYAGAWIEIADKAFKTASSGASLPTRERGLKSFGGLSGASWVLVAPYAGAWIEITSLSSSDSDSTVAPYAGAWIEIILATSTGCIKPSLPTRERGLKLGMDGLTGGSEPRRSLRGSVDWNHLLRR